MFNMNIHQLNMTNLEAAFFQRCIYIDSDKVGVYFPE